MTRGGNASGKQAYLYPAGPEDETTTGRREEDAPVRVPQVMQSLVAYGYLDSISRTAVYVTRAHGGVGGGAP
mgnify:CR=1 FL=1